MSEQIINLKGIETIYDFSKRKKKGIPPVEKWNPPFCGDIDMHILRNGKWTYMGSEIKRPAMIKLFSNIIRLDEDGHYYLVTPVEKVRIKVDDVPFVAVSMNKTTEKGIDSLSFVTNVQDEVVLSKENPIEIVINDNDEPSPYITIRRNLKALISRAVYYDLINMAEEEIIDDKKFLVIKSNNTPFKLYQINNSA
ncbi:uncharacterized protein METZ01_LOCUS114989 [marine metagenome]|uniref:DUF1285 domain-containing protein n=1 Tax=marine metagenome TaxID=408172 RepID=A0A381XBJ7_9ZZZZ|tara:strand:+ start:267 stop:851 length:585 start_codon:yes stop_codon:yes gene_type:complete